MTFATLKLINDLLEGNAKIKETAFQAIRKSYMEAERNGATEENLQSLKAAKRKIYEESLEADRALDDFQRHDFR